MNYLDKYSQNIDEKTDLVVNKNPDSSIDGGDSAQRTGMFFFYIKIIDHLMKYSCEYENAFLRGLKSIEIRSGLYIRYPARARNWHHWDIRDFSMWDCPCVFSRDQQISLIISMGAYELKDHLHRLFIRNLRRGLLCQNLDLMGPHHLGAYVRSAGFKFLYPFLYFSDLFLLIAVLGDWIKSKIKPGDYTDLLNGTMLHVQSVLSMPTFISRLAVKIIDKNKLKDSLKRYFESDSRELQMHELIIPAIERYLE